MSKKFRKGYFFICFWELLGSLEWVEFSMINGFQIPEVHKFLGFPD